MSSMVFLTKYLIIEIKTARHSLKYIVGICSTIFLGHLFILVNCVQLTKSEGHNDVYHHNAVSQPLQVHLLLMNIMHVLMVSSQTRSHFC